MDKQSKDVAGDPKQVAMVKGTHKVVQGDIGVGSGKPGGTHPRRQRRGG